MSNNTNENKVIESNESIIAELDVKLKTAKDLSKEELKKTLLEIFDDGNLNVEFFNDPKVKELFSPYKDELIQIKNQGHTTEEEAKS